MIYLSTTTFEQDNYSIAQMVDFAHQNNCGLEFGSNSLAPTMALSDINIPLLIHNYNPIQNDPFVLNLVANDPVQLLNSIEMVARNLSESFRFGLPFYGLHAGFLAPIDPSMLGAVLEGRAQPLNKSYEYYCKQFAEGLKKAIKKSKVPKDYPILIENNVIGAKNFERGFAPHLMALGGEDTIELIEVCQSFNINAGLLFDTGHANVSSNQLGYDRCVFHQQVENYICAYHLSENNGLEDTNNVITEDAWFLPFLRKCRNPIVTIEVAGPVSSLSRQIKILRENGC